LTEEAGAFEIESATALYAGDESDGQIARAAAEIEAAITAS